METASTARRLNRRRATAGIAALAVATLALTACGGGSFAGGADEGAAGAEDRAFRLGLVAPTTGVASLEGSSLVMGAKLGTSSLRRQAQVKRRRPDLAVAPFRGNVDTRLQKLEQGSVDATLLAYAGLKRLGLESRGHGERLGGGAAGRLHLDSHAVEELAPSIRARKIDPRGHALGHRRIRRCLRRDRGKHQARDELRMVDRQPQRDAATA